jgi:hypothetical protein
MQPINPATAKRLTSVDEDIAGKKLRNPNILKHAKTNALITFSFISPPSF